jgi:hypothetical protein
MWMLKILTAFFGVFGRGRSPAGLLNLVTPRSGYTIRRDVAYGEDARQRLDVYVPLNLAAPAPVVLFFYGGAFRAGRRDEYRVVGQALASKGIVAAIADYRIYPPARFPDFLEDGAHALAAVHAWAEEFRGGLHLGDAGGKPCLCSAGQRRSVLDPRGHRDCRALSRTAAQ